MAHPAPPEPPLPAAGAAPPPVLPPTPPPRFYRELYGDDRNNPPADRIARYMAGYRFMAEPGGAAVPTPAALRDQTIILSDRQPMAFLALITDQGGRYEVVVLHRMMRYMDSPGDDPSGYHDQVLGLLGDIMPHQYPVVEVSGNAFHLVGMPTRVPTVAAMAALIPTWEDTTPTLGPYKEEAGETEVVRPRHIQIIPGRYAAILVHR